MGYLDDVSISASPNTTNESTQIPSLIKLPWNARLAVSAACVAIYAILFLMILAQIVLTLYYRYKKLSYRMAVFSLCLTWAALRVVMFGLYFEPALCTVAFDLPVEVYWLLYALPVCFQFAALALFALYFLQVVVKARARDIICLVTLRTSLVISWVVINVTFLTANTVCAVLSYYQFNDQRFSPDGAGVNNEVFTQPKDSPDLYVRVMITEGLFLAVAIVISGCIVKIARNHCHQLTLETQGMSVWQSKLVACVLVFLYVTRIAYNLASLGAIKQVNSFGYNWPIVSDEAEFGADAGTGYVIFSIALTFWEFLPTLMVTFYFRVKRPVTSRANNKESVTDSNSRTTDARSPLLVSYFKKPDTKTIPVTVQSQYGSRTTATQVAPFSYQSLTSGYHSSGHSSLGHSINT